MYLRTTMGFKRKIHLYLIDAQIVRHPARNSPEFRVGMNCIQLNAHALTRVSVLFGTVYSN